MNCAETQRWLQQPGVVNTQFLINKVFALAHRDLCDASRKGIETLRTIHGQDNRIRIWQSAFSSMSLITNRITPYHRDNSGREEYMDVLFSAGAHDNALIRILDIETDFLYLPGTVIALSSRALKHGVEGWEGNDRICVVNFTRDEFLERLAVTVPVLPQIELYLDLMPPRTRTTLKDLFLQPLPIPELMAGKQFKKYV